MVSTAPTVLFDLTILSTTTRTHGIGRYVSDLAPKLAEHASDVRMRFVSEIGWSGVTIDDDPVAAIARLKGAPVAKRWSWAYRLRLGIARAARVANADIVHLPHMDASPVGRSKPRRIITCLDLIPLRYPQHYVGWQSGWTRGRRWLDGRRLGNADHIIAISQATADDVCALTGTAPAKVTPILLGVDTTRFEPTPQPSDANVVAALGVRGPYVFYAGAADWRKNAEGMFRATQRTKTATSLVWSGRLPDGTRRQLEALARQVGARVTFVGYVSDETLGALYRSAKATLFVSRAEGFGYPVVEAMAAGCPVITSNVSSLPEVAAGAAILVDPERPDAIADAIDSLDEPERSRLRALGFARARALNLDRPAQETLATYRRVCEAMRAR